MRTFDFVAYILAALQNAGFADQREREEAAHDVIVQLLVSPGQLFAGYADTSGPMEARFRIAVQNAVRNLLRTRRRQPTARAVSIGYAAGEMPADAIPDRHRDDDEVLAAFRDFLRREVGEDAVRLLDQRLDGVSLRQLAGHLSQRDVIRHPEFRSMGEWRIRRLMARIRDAAVAFAELQGDDAVLAAINRLTRTDEWCGGRAGVAA
jgi:hypothetical protein